MSNSVHTDELYMSECLRLAQKGEGAVSPNPMVGSVIVKRGKIIGKGYHKKFGGPHAEVHAIANATESVKGATLYVNLEPCNFTGKTPPCTDLLISSSIGRVVVGMKDPNPRVSGNGIRRLRQAGIEVTAGVLKSSAEKLNEAFAKYILTGIPFVTLKIAQTLDGNIADANGKSQWITGTASRAMVHRLRAGYDAVLVGANTVKKDNPSLTVREAKGRNPVRIILDGALSSPLDAKVFTDGLARTVVLTHVSESNAQKKKKKIFQSHGIEIIEIESSGDGALFLSKALQEIGKRNIASLLVEGGAVTFSHFIRQQQADKLLLFVAPKLLGAGLNSFSMLRNLKLGADDVQLTRMSAHNIGKDILIEAYC